MEEMEMVLPSKYVDLDEQEITYGGMSWYKGVLIGVTVAQAVQAFGGLGAQLITESNVMLAVGATSTFVALGAGLAAMSVDVDHTIYHEYS